MEEPMRATAEVIRPDETEVHDAEVVDADWETVPTSSPRSGSTRPVLPAGGPTSSDAGSRTGSRKGEPTVTVMQMPSGRPDTQYRDAELTVFDVIEADADMAEQITAGVDEAVGAANGCDRLYRKLEELHAKVVELRVPGVLEGMVLGLMDRTGHVKAKAEAIAQKLPAASEAIATAGVNAETRHRPLADAVRDAGHVRPAERDYHNE
jgi:hypothetical protein